MPRPKKQPNDQGQLIEYLKQKNYEAAWDIVNMIGVQEMPNYAERMLIFSKAVNKFDPYRNNNFIMYYKTQIYWYIRNTHKIKWDLEAIWPTE